MKVQVTVTQVMTYEITTEVEMTKEQYNAYLKTGKYSNELMYEVSSEINDEHWIATEERITSIEKL